jgi:hypothetical protein
MIKFLAIVILIGTVGGGIYYLFSMEVEEDFKVTGTLQVSEQIGKNINESQETEASYFAAVHGRIKNNLGKPIKNLFVIYIIDGQKVSATIFDLAPGQQVEFNTHGVKTSAPSPQFNFEGVNYD